VALTLGTASQPNQLTTNLDALFSTSLANYNRTLVDNIGKQNALLDKIMRNGGYKSVDGGTHIVEPLMYALGTGDWYDGYDTLADDTVEGITQALFEWRQLAFPISYSMKEVKQNKQRLVSLVQAKITQAEMGIKEKMNTAILQGAGSGSTTTAQSSGVNGASGVDPLPKLIAYDPTASVEIGGINQSTATWWRNQKKESAATTYTGLLTEMTNLYNNCSNGTGGQPDLIIADQTSYELFQAAMYEKWRKLENDKNFNWENTKFKNAVVTYDEKVPNVFAGTLDTTTTTGGTMYFINTKFFKLQYEAATNFVTSPFAKPTNQDTRLAHIMWMGNLTISNRRKHGVLGKIARTLTA
jgi:hypothetical protein